MSTEQERIVRWKSGTVIVVAVIGAALLGLDLITGAEWSATVLGAIKGLFAA